MTLQPNRWLIGIVGITATLYAVPCIAQFEAVCRPLPYNGRVKTVVQEEAPADSRTGSALRTPEVRSKTEISSDGRVMTERSMDIDSLRQAALGLYPTTIKEYDASGRMVSETQKANGVTTSRTIVCEYDNQGRLSRATTKFRVPGLDQHVSYAYGPSWRSERFVSAVASILTTVTLDSRNRPVREVRFDEIRKVELSVTDYRETLEGVEQCVRQHDVRDWCGVSIHDPRGNRIEFRSSKRSVTTAYQYDSFGNWVSRVISNGSDLAQGTWRKITYW